MRSSPRGHGAGEELKAERPARPAPIAACRKPPACRAEGHAIAPRRRTSRGSRHTTDRVPAATSPGPGPRLCPRPRRRGAGVADPVPTTVSKPAPRGPRRHSRCRQQFTLFTMCGGRRPRHALVERKARVAPSHRRDQPQAQPQMWLGGDHENLPVGGRQSPAGGHRFSPSVATVSAHGSLLSCRYSGARPR